MGFINLSVLSEEQNHEVSKLNDTVSFIKWNNAETLNDIHGSTEGLIGKIVGWIKSKADKFSKWMEARRQKRWEAVWKTPVESWIDKLSNKSLKIAPDEMVYDVVPSRNHLENFGIIDRMITYVLTLNVADDKVKSNVFKHAVVSKVNRMNGKIKVFTYNEENDSVNYGVGDKDFVDLRINGSGYDQVSLSSSILASATKFDNRLNKVSAQYDSLYSRLTSMAYQFANSDTDEANRFYAKANFLLFIAEYIIRAGYKQLYLTGYIFNQLSKVKFVSSDKK